jgi:ribosomal protein S18 acetylase RimI-like enzyme
MMNYNQKSNKETNENKIIFFSKTDRTDCIRTLKTERNDYDALARCYNSFKDSDSWPGGFGGSTDFTGEILEKEYEGKDHSPFFVITDPKEHEKIVGVSLCSQTWNTSDGWYIMLLGVDPAYQGQKLGKALLLYSTKFATEKKAKLITLHTWGGNLKAMPFYKRQGYKWRPYSSVYMENYIPQILRYKPFRKLFSKYYWYDSYQPTINQIPDETYEGKMQVYDYHFKMSEKETLTVWIDRTIGRISGFQKKTETEDLLIKGFTPDSEAYIGIDTFTTTLTIENNGLEKKNLEVKVESSQQLKTIGKTTHSFVIEPGEKRIIEIEGSIDKSAEEINLEIDYSRYTDHYITFNVKCDNQTFPVVVGKLPKKAIDMQPLERTFCVEPNSIVTLPLVIINKLEKEKEVTFRIEGGQKVRVKKKKLTKKISRYDSTFNLEVEVAASESLVDWISITAVSPEGSVYQEKKLPVLIFNRSKALSYHYEQKIFIENKYYQLSLYKPPQPESNSISIIDKRRDLGLDGQEIALGYPIIDEGSEFTTKKLEHQLVKHPRGVLLESSAPSEKKRGITVTRRIFFPHDDDVLLTSLIVKNDSNQKKTNLGIQLGFWWWRFRRPLLQAVFPHKDGIKTIKRASLDIHLKDDPTDYLEGWKALEFTNGTIGIMFNHEKAKKTHPSHRFPYIQYPIPELNPKTSYVTEPFAYCFCDNWQMVRKKWQELFQKKRFGSYDYFLEPETQTEIGLSKESISTIHQGLIIDSKCSEFFATIKSIGEITFKGKIDIELDEPINKKWSLSLPEKTMMEWKENLAVILHKKTITAGKINLDNRVRKYFIPIALAPYSSEGKISITKKTIEKEYLEVDNGRIRFRGSAEHKGSVFHLSVKQKQPPQVSDNYFNTFFPEVKPFLYDNQFYGGLNTILTPAKTWIGIEKFYNNANFTATQVQKGQWKGIGFSSQILEFHPTIKGLQLTTNYLTLPDSPILLAQHIISNHSDRKRECKISINAYMRTSSTTEDRYYLENKNGQTIEYFLQDYNPNAGLEQKTYGRWAAFQKKGNKNLFGIASLVNKIEHGVYIHAATLNSLTIGCEFPCIKTQPHQDLEINVLYLVAKSHKIYLPLVNTSIKEFFD